MWQDLFCFGGTWDGRTKTGDTGPPDDIRKVSGKPEILEYYAGMDEYDALRAITIHPAEHIGIADRVGSLEEGKDADIVIADGSPFELTGVIRHVLIDGKEVK